MLRNYYLRRLKNLFMLMILPTLLIFIVLGYAIFSFQQGKVSRECDRLLDSYEENIATNIYHIGYQLDNLNSNASVSLTLKKMLANINMKQDELTAYNIVKQMLRSIEATIPCVTSIYLFRDESERFLTSTGQITSCDTYYDKDWLAHYREMPENCELSVESRMIQRNSFDGPERVLTMYYRTIYMDGVIVINVNQRKFEEQLLSPIAAKQHQVFLLNQEGQLLSAVSAGNDKKERFTDQVDQQQLCEKEKQITEAIGTLSKEKTVSGWYRLDGTLSYLTTRYSPHMDMYYVSVITADYFMSEMWLYVVAAAVVLLFDILISFGLAYRQTKKSFAYIRQYIDIFAAAEKGEALELERDEENTNKDEYELILKNIVYMHLRHTQMTMDLEERKRDSILAEMAALQMQINPHFIQNTLQIMDFEAIRQLGKESMVHHMISQLSEVVKYALSEPMELVPLETEIRYLKAYLEIQNIRFSNRGILYFDIDEELMSLQVFRILLQPLVENAFEHGMYGDERRIIIKIRMFLRNGDVHVSVIDNGKGMTREELAELRKRINSRHAKNIGVTNLNRRLMLHYGENRGLKIDSRKGRGTLVSFVIPAQHVSFQEPDENIETAKIETK